MSILVIISFACLGAVVGSFIGVLAERVYTGQAWAKSRSRCDSCARTLEAVDLVPIVSWLLSRGRCRSCGSYVSAYHPAFEIALATLFVLAGMKIGFDLALLPFLLALSVLTFIVMYDVRHTLVPPAASFALVVVSLWFAYLSLPHLGGALVWAGSIGLAFVVLHVCSRGKAMGLADAPIAFSLALLAAPYAFSGLLFSFWIGALYGIGVLVLRRHRHTMGTEVPFVPFLALGFLLAYFTEWNLLPL